MVVWITVKRWQVEGTAIFFPNVVSFLLTSGARQWYVVGAYVSPNNVPTLHRVEQALRLAPKGFKLILVGELNARLGDPRDKQ